MIFKLYIRMKAFKEQKAEIAELMKKGRYMCAGRIVDLALSKNQEA